jgi:hypothetical protein
VELALVVSIYAEEEGRSTPPYSQPKSVAEHLAAGRSVLGSKLDVHTPSGRSVELLLSTE